jgi:hypothetical protein
LVFMTRTFYYNKSFNAVIEEYKLSIVEDIKKG